MKILYRGVEVELDLVNKHLYGVRQDNSKRLHSSTLSQDLERLVRDIPNLTDDKRVYYIM